MMLAAMGTLADGGGGGGDEFSIGEHRIRLAQEKLELQETGDGLDGRVQKLETEIRAMENTLRVLNAANSCYKASLSSVNPASRCPRTCRLWRSFIRSLLLPVFRRRVQRQDGPGRDVRGAQQHVAAEEENGRKPGERNPSEFAVPSGRRVYPSQSPGLCYTVLADGADPRFRRVWGQNDFCSPIHILEIDDLKKVTRKIIGHRLKVCLKHVS